MKILMIGSPLDGSQALDVLQLVNSLSEKEDVYYFGPKQLEFKDLLDNNVKFIEYDFLKFSTKLLEKDWTIDILREIKYKVFINLFVGCFSLLIETFKIRPDVIHIYWPGFGRDVTAIYLLIMKLFKKKIVWTSPNVVAHERDKTLAKYFSFYYYLVDAIIVFSQENKRMLTDEFKKINAKKVKIVPYGNLKVLDQGKFNKKSARKLLGIENRFVIGHIGNIRQYKGINVLVEAFQKISRKDDIGLLLVGPWWIEDKKLRNELENDESIYLIDKRIHENEIEPYFKACDVIVASYPEFEGYSSLVVASFSFGIPVIATNVGSLPDLVKNKKTGKLIEPNDPDSLRESIEWMYDNPKKIKEMSQNCKKVAEERLGWNVIRDKMFEIYRSI